MHGDKKLAETAYKLFKRSLAWWDEYRFDTETGLYSALFEETFIPNTESVSCVYAAVDTNAELILGLRNAAALCAGLGKTEESEIYTKKASALCNAADRYFWNDEDGCCYPYVLTEKCQQKTLMVSTFNGFYFLSEDRRKRLVTLLRAPDIFNRRRYALTSVATTDPLFTTTEGSYQGNRSWGGSVWTMTNMSAMKALLYAGYKDDAKMLALQTVGCFKGNYAELVNPFTRHGEGVLRYGWTAGQFIQTIVEILFGISYTAGSGLKVAPLLTEGEYALTGLLLPDGRTVNVCVGREICVEYV